MYSTGIVLPVCIVLPVHYMYHSTTGTCTVLDLVHYRYTTCTSTGAGITVPDTWCTSCTARWRAGYVPATMSDLHEDDDDEDQKEKKSPEPEFKELMYKTHGGTELIIHIDEALPWMILFACAWLAAPAAPALFFCS